MSYDEIQEGERSGPGPSELSLKLSSDSASSDEPPSDLEWCRKAEKPGANVVTSCSISTNLFQVYQLCCDGELDNKHVDLPLSSLYLCLQSLSPQPVLDIGRQHKLPRGPSLLVAVPFQDCSTIAD